MSSLLPVKPSLEHLKKEAKQLLRSHRKRDKSVLGRLKLLPKFTKSAESDIFGAPLTLQEAQHALALDYGFPNWHELRARIGPDGRNRKMAQQRVETSLDELWAAQRNMIVERAKELYAAGNTPIRILDVLVRAGDRDKVPTYRSLVEAGVDFEYVCTDDHPTYLPQFRNRFLGQLNERDLARLKFVLVDQSDWRQEPKSVYLFGENVFQSRKLPIEQILAMPEFDFLREGYDSGRRKENFADESFDLIINTVRLEEMTRDLERGVKETVRMLKKGGYLVLTDGHLKKVASYMRRSVLTIKNIAQQPLKLGNMRDTVRRTFGAIRRAKHDPERTEKAMQLLGAALDLQSIVWAEQKRGHDDGLAYQTWQKGDTADWYVALYRKPIAK